jgi:hypothetical protein
MSVTQLFYRVFHFTGKIQVEGAGVETYIIKRE